MRINVLYMNLVKTRKDKITITESETEMFKSGNINKEKDNPDEFEGLGSNSGQIDSGFLSGANIGDHSEFGGAGLSEVDHHSDGKELKHIQSEEMRADSGIVEVGLSQTLSHLTLKPVTINCLKGKVQSEPTVELSKVSVTNQDAIRHDDQTRHLWQLYYSQDEDGDTQLHIAIVQGFHEVALSLIRMAPVPSMFDFLNNKRQSPLHLAVLTHQYIIARHLVLAGANPGLRNSDGNTALHLAAISGDLACARSLTDELSPSERSCLAPGIPLHYIEQRNYEGETCLHSAVVAGNIEIVRLLISIGSDIEAKERLGGRTALHLAIECRRRSVTTYLLTECNPELDALTYAGLTPYEIAACWDSQLAKELVRLGASDTPLTNYMETNDAADISKMSSQLWQGVGLRA